nr:MAG TPA: hypothetical protein [Caudoviricetes sp.]
MISFRFSSIFVVIIICFVRTFIASFYWKTLQIWLIIFNHANKIEIIFN